MHYMYNCNVVFSAAFYTACALPLPFSFGGKPGSVRFCANRPLALLDPVFDNGCGLAQRPFAVKTCGTL